MAEWFHAKSASVTVKDGRWDRTMIMVGYLSYGGEEEGERGGGGREGRRGGGGVAGFLTPIAGQESN